MKRTYHVHVRHVGARPVFPAFSEDKYSDAVRLAVDAYRAAPNDTQVEITYMSHVVWGPYVKGSKLHVPSECPELRPQGEE